MSDEKEETKEETKESSVEIKTEEKEITSHDVITKGDFEKLKKQLERSKADNESKKEIIAQLEEFLQWKITSNKEPKPEVIEVKKNVAENKPKFSFSVSNLFENINDILFNKKEG